MIRKLTAQDREIYLSLAHAFYQSSAVLAPVPDSHLEATFDELMRSDVYAEGYLLEWEGEAAGYALISKTFSQEAGGLTVWLEELFVLPEYRSHGLGRSFLEFLGREYAAAKRLRLEVEAENVRAVALYEKLGFRVLPYAQMVKENIP